MVDEPKKKRIPKRIGDVKIPKDLRRKGEALIDTAVASANSPIGREMIVGALAMAATAATAAMARGRAATADVPPAPPPAEATPGTPTPPPHGTTREPDFAVIAETIGHTAEMVFARLFGNKGD